MRKPVDMGSFKKWYAVYTKSRWEKKVNQLFREKGLESYCPLNKVHRKWSDRIKLVEEPLFKSYVFVKLSENEKTAARMTNGVVNFVYWLGKPAIIRDKEIDLIRRFMDEHDNVKVSQANIEPQNKVTVRKGVLMNQEGTVLRVLKNKIELAIESIGYTLIVYVDKSKVAIKKNSR